MQSLRCINVFWQLTTSYAMQFAGLAPGPYAGQVLQDWGARVICVDRVDGTNRFRFLARGKRSIAVNSKVPGGLKLLKSMIQQSDVLIDPFRPGVMERLGLGPDVFLGKDGLNDKLVYARLSGCVPCGPSSNSWLSGVSQTYKRNPQVPSRRYSRSCVRLNS
jgi:alpha-methylacyl-CoA racemase